MRKILIGLTIVAVLALLSIWYCNSQVLAAAEGKIYTRVEDIPSRHTGLLLGTGKYLQSGYENLYYTYRIQAALQLMNAGKISYLIISGDNSRKDYNEPEMMRADLMKLGVDSSRIFLDYAGFRTFDSIIRLREIFSQHSATIISQRFHNERALYIAKREGIEAIAFDAQDVGGAAADKMEWRERLARVKVFADYATGTDPKFLGPKVQIP